MTIQLAVFVSFWLFQFLLILIEDIVTSISKKKSIHDANWASDKYLSVSVCDKFWAARNGKKVKFGTFQAQPTSVRVISYIFVCKKFFRVISMIKMVILDQSKPISLYLKIQKSKIRKLYVYYS